MHRLRTTFTRSRTPTGAEMKTQSSLEVPKQVRSASFDEMKLETQRTAQLLKHQASADEQSTTGFLQVPQAHSQRSRSFDSAGSDDSGTFLEVPRRFQTKRRSSNTKTPPPCIHCQYLEEYERQVTADQRYFIDQNEVKSLSYSDPSTSEDEGVDEESPQFGNTLIPPPLSSPCNITFTLSPTSSTYPPFPTDAEILGSPPVSPVFTNSPTIELPPITFDEAPPPRARRRSISRQEAIFVEPKGNSLENVSAEEKEPGEETDSAVKDQEAEKQTEKDKAVNEVSPLDHVQDIYLAVPDLKRDRAASVDSCFSKVSSAGKTEELQPPDDGSFLNVPSINATRSRSVDIVLPTNEQARYKALAMTGAVAYGEG
ncbi:unnamed protein product [Hermetia illucens]|nr:unnamed protein product [Hermetia illucens]